MTRLRYNGLATGAAGSLAALTLGGSLTNSATSVTFSAALTYANGTAVPTITGSDYIPLSILDAAGNVAEIVYLTAYTSAATTGTIARGKEGTTGVAHASGAPLVHAPSVLDIHPEQNVWDVVADFGAVVDGVTDDTAAWQAAITAAGTAGGGTIRCSKVGVSIIAGALQDTGGANAQLLLPAVDAVDSENISITIRGSIAPPVTFSVVGATPIPDNHLVIKSTLTSGSGGALLGAKGPVGTYESFTNVDLTLRDISFRLPSNPTHSALDLRNVTCVDLDQVTVDCGGYYVQGFTEPTTTTSYAIRLPKLNNGAHNRLGKVDVAGFYTGLEVNEHTKGEYVAAWGCKRAVVFTEAYHASAFTRLMAVHCERGIVFTGGAHYVDIWQFNIEHAASGWWVTDYDIDDASNYGKGFVRWHVVLAGVGVDSTFTVNGATNITRTRIGDPLYTLDTTAEAERVRDTIGTALVAGANVTITPNDGADTITIAASSFDAETVRDTIAAALVEGTGIDIVYDDGADTITITATGGGGGGTDVATDTIWDAKGDLAVGTAADTAARHAVGANNAVLMADSGEATGLKWGPTFGTFTPTLTATTTNPTMGTGAVTECRYVTLGELVIATYYIKFGTSPAAGSGTYQCSVPVNIDTTMTAANIGNGGVFDASAGASRTVAVIRASTSLVQFIVTGSGLASNSVPWTWAAGDELFFTLMYEKA